jgi:hypothetical protein
MLYQLDHILTDLNSHLKNKKSFSIVRLGDGDLKMIKIMLRGEYAARKFRQQGIPNNKEAFEKVLTIYRKSCNSANYISNFDVYFDEKILWRRTIKHKTLIKMEDWRKVYKDIGITNESYCSPELGVYFFLRRKVNLFNLMKDIKICLITCFPAIEGMLRKLGYNVSTFEIPGRFGNHYSHYDKKIRKLKSIVKDYDLFIVGGGMFGRGYSNCIKRNGGITIDVGQVFDIWNDVRLPERLRGLVKYNRKKMDFILTEKGKLYEGVI